MEIDQLIIVDFFRHYAERFINLNDIRITSSYKGETPSKWSTSFSFINKRHNELTQIEVLRIISRIFDKQIEYNNLYKIRLEDATSGKGNEYKRFTTLHSSSLCSFLHFYQVSEENCHSLMIPINGESIEFNHVLFEVENPCINGNNSMDLVLISKKSKIILFLESKFSEYLNNSNKPIALTYQSIYDQLFQKCPISENITYQVEKINKNDVQIERIVLNKPPHYPLYADGIKQMISHYISLTNFINGTTIKENRLRFGEIGLSYDNVIKDQEYQFYLGEILFDFESYPQTTPFLENYRKEYQALQSNLKKHSSDMSSNIYFLGDLLLYSDIFNSKNNPNYMSLMSKEINFFYSHTK